jgi:hypothetical protein
MKNTVGVINVLLAGAQRVYARERKRYLATGRYDHGKLMIAARNVVEALLRFKALKDEETP